jgi:hypothetical protein
MTISLTQIIAALEAKANSTDSASSISDVLRLSIGSEAVSDGAIIYDSAGVMPTDSAFIGTMAAASNGTIRLYTGQGWDTLDSSSYTAPLPPWYFQGSTSGYVTGGVPGLTDNAKTIEKYSFTSDGNATDVGDLTRRVTNPGTGGSSSTDGYQLSGGNPGQVVTVDKFPFASDANAATTNNHVAHKNASYSSSEYAAYQVAGVNPWPGGFTTRVSKYEFAADTSNTNVGDTATISLNSYACNSGTVLYAYGGANASVTTINAIEKFPFATEGTMTDVGDLTIARRAGGNAVQGQNSSSHGYASGGTPWPDSTIHNTIDKFPFASDANATDVGDTTVSAFEKNGTSSTVSGYGAGGDLGPTDTNVIDKFPFSTDANATDVGDLSFSHRTEGTMQV